MRSATSNSRQPFVGFLTSVARVQMVYDKPMIYYPLTTLMLGGLRDFIIISSPEALDQLRALLGDGTRWGISITYRTQESAGGIAECFRIANADIAGCNVAVALGDNIF